MNIFLFFSQISLQRQNKAIVVLILKWVKDLVVKNIKILTQKLVREANNTKQRSGVVAVAVVGVRSSSSSPAKRPRPLSSSSSWTTPAFYNSRSSAICTVPFAPLLGHGHPRGLR